MLEHLMPVLTLTVPNFGPHLPVYAHPTLSAGLVANSVAQTAVTLAMLSLSRLRSVQALSETPEGKKLPGVCQQTDMPAGQHTHGGGGSSLAMAPGAGGYKRMHASPPLST
jgi:hypothetical protein